MGKKRNRSGYWSFEDLFGWNTNGAGKSPQMNKKSKKTGDHTWYNPNTRESGQAGGNRDKKPK